jgi:leucyl-tRNA synthetase
MVLNHIYSRKNEKGGIEYFWPDDVENILGADGRITGARLKADGSAIDYNGIGTMSKSKNNGVDPQDLIEKYGADTARLYTMFTSPPEDTLLWSDAGVDGSARFLKRLWAFGYAWSNAIESAGAPNAATLPGPLSKLRREVHAALKQIDFDIGRIQYNTVVSGAMKMLNALETAPRGDGAAAAVVREGLSILLRALNPVVPHITHVLWQELGFAAASGDILDAPWPKVLEEALKSDVIELVLQVNGKHRGSVLVPATADKAAIEGLAVASESAQKYLEGKAPKKVIVVPGRLVNIVV